MIEENEYQEFFKKALEKAGKSIPSMSDEEKRNSLTKYKKLGKVGEKKNEGKDLQKLKKMVMIHLR